MLEAKTIIVRELAVDVSSLDHEDANGFFVRANTGGILIYVPLLNTDEEDPITKTITASTIFNDPTLIRKIISDGTTASGIHIGKGI